MENIALYDRSSSSGVGSQSDSRKDLPYELPSSSGRRTPPTFAQTLQERIQRRLDNYPRIQKVYEYVRGPRPQRELSDPKPILDIDFTIRNTHIRLPIESTFIRYTRPFTSPYLLLLLIPAYIIGLAFLSRAQSFLTPASSFIGCTDTFWLAQNQCGLNGEECLSTDTDIDALVYDYRCPAQCTGTILQNPRTVGDGEIAYVPLLVGGGDGNGTYRGDSFICSAAVQAGIINDDRGGCFSMNLVSNFTDFIPFTQNGLSSIGFPTIFPIGFRFLSSTSLSHCSDLRTEALIYNTLVTCLLFFVLRPAPLVRLWCLMSIGFWHIVLFSHPTSYPPGLSTAFSTFLPCLFITYAFWRLAVRFTLVPALTQHLPLELGVYYVGPFWVGVLSNLTLDAIPFSRLYAPDLHARPGGLTALVIIVLVVFVLVVNQARVFRKTGYLLPYLAWYAAGGLIVMVLALLPGLNLRLHHYFIAMVLMPVTAMPTRLSAVYQGFLLGLFLEGAASYGLDAILQTSAELREDATIGSALPSFLTNSSTYNSSAGLIAWDALPSSSDGDSWDGFSLLVDDVERYVGAALNFSLGALQEGVPHFFRLALSVDGTVGDYTKAATIYPNGTFVDPASGAS